MSLSETSDSGSTPGDAAAPSASELTPATNSRVVTWLAAVACVVVFFGLASEKDVESWETLSQWGYLPAEAIWRGSWWALLSTPFVHLALWHVGFNVYWLWILGSRMEQSVGPLKYLVFLAASAFVSSGSQLAASDSTGIGMSGVVYAIFGFLWTLRSRDPEFARILDERTVTLFCVWLVGCVVATWTGFWEVGNAAHISGMLFGGAVAGAFILHSRPALVLLAALVAASITVLLWCPWSVGWLSVKAYDFHAAQKYDKAIDCYTLILRREPANAWALGNRAGAYRAIGDDDQARRDWENARAIDPTVGQEAAGRNEQ